MQLTEVTAALPAPQVAVNKCETCLWFAPPDRHSGLCCHHLQRVFGRDIACTQYVKSAIENQ